MFFSRPFVFGSVLMASAPALAAPLAPPSPVSALKYDFAEDDLEARWSWRGDAVLPVRSEIGVALGWKDAKNASFLSFRNDGKALTATLSSVKDGASTAVASGKTVVTTPVQGQLGLQRVGNLTRVLWNGRVVVEANLPLPGVRFGSATRGAAKLSVEAPQPTEAVVFRDDFMRAQGPEDKEIPGEWKVTGVWKTSGSLGPKSEAALNPNPFVFRSQGANSAARAGKWWWSGYSVSTSVCGTQSDSKAPLIAGIEAFSDEKNGGLRAEIDFARGVASIKDGDKVLAQSPTFDAEPGQWHRLRFEPGPGTARLFLDGVLRVAAASGRAQGGMALRATTGGSNYVDFDDVRVGLQSGHQWGEGALPERFQKDRLMRNWASDASAWKRDGGGVWWHTGDFFGATQLEMPVPALNAGDGFELIFAADPQNENSGVRYEILRPGEKKELVARLKSHEMAKSGSLVIPMSGAVMPLRLKFNVKNSVSASLVGDLNGQKIGKTSIIPVPRLVRGTKLGIRPLKNGAPLPPPSLQKLTISSATFERESRAMIGINFTPVSEDIARQLGLPNAAGAVVDNVEGQSPAKKAGVREGDVIRSVDGVTITDIDSMRSAVGSVKPGTVIKLDLLRPQSEPSGLNWEHTLATTPNVLDYSFTAAPVDWRAARGTWEISERWTCSPQWSFFAGHNDPSPLLWSRFATQGDWTLEAYLATPMDLVRGERSPSDLNVTVGGDGVDLASGYSFLFGGVTRTVNQIRRGDAVAWEKPFEALPGAGDTHQDWFYVRLEKRQTAQGVRFRYSVNGREVANYLDPKPLADGGHIGFWTQNGGLSIARVRLWNAGMRAPLPGKANAILARNSKISPANVLGNWSPRGEGQDASARLILASQESGSTGTPKAAPNKPALQIVNPRSGGDWTTYVTRKAFSATAHPVLQWDYRAESGVKINLYALVDNIWREIVFTGDAKSTDASDVNQLGRVEISAGDGKWHHARFDLDAALTSKGLGKVVESLAFAAPDRGYLRSGLGGNHRGATYWLRDFRAKK